MSDVCVLCMVFFVFKQKTAYEMRISDWSSDVCSSDLIVAEAEDGLVIVDQHAAHERLVLETLKHGMAGQAVPSQGLLLPEVVELDEPACDRLEAAAPQLAALGVELERFGPAAVMEIGRAHV